MGTRICRASGIFALLCLGLLSGCASLTYDDLTPEETRKKITERKSNTAYLLDPVVVGSLSSGGVVLRQKSFSAMLSLKLRDKATGEVRTINQPAILGVNTVNLSAKEGPEWDTLGKYLASTPSVATFTVSCSTESCVAIPSGITVKDDGEILVTQTPAIDAEQVKYINKLRQEEKAAAKEAAQTARNEAYRNSHLNSLIPSQSRKVIDKYNKVLALQNKMSALRQCRYTEECQENAAKAVKLSSSLESAVWSYQSESETLKDYFARYSSSKGPKALRGLLVKEGVTDVCKVTLCGNDVWIP